jgi:hypothetical protein
MSCPKVSAKLLDQLVDVTLGKGLTLGQRVGRADAQFCLKIRGDQITGWMSRGEIKAALCSAISRKGEQMLACLPSSEA